MTSNDMNVDISRRDILSTLGKSSVGTALLTGTVSGESTRYKTIPLAKSGETVIETHEVPERWYNHQKQVQRAKESHKSKLTNTPGVAAVSIGTRDETIGGYRKQVLEVEHERRTTPEIPDSVEGIKIHTSRYEPSEPTASVNAGDDIQVRKDSSTVKNGTGMTSVEFVRDKYYATARHLFADDSCDSDTKYSRMELDNDTRWGQLYKDWKRHDVAIVQDPFGENTAGNCMDHEDSPAKCVVGRVTYDTLSSFISDETIVHKHGRESGTRSDTIKSYDRDDLVDCHVDIVDTNIEQKQGDSGGPIYFESSYYLYAVGIATHRGSFWKEARGAGAHAMYNKDFISFGDYSY